MTAKRTFESFALASLPGCGIDRGHQPVVSLRSTTGYRLPALRAGNVAEFARIQSRAASTSNDDRHIR
jgi:hypothetical protein